MNSIFAIKRTIIVFNIFAQYEEPFKLRKYIVANVLTLAGNHKKWHLPNFKSQSQILYSCDLFYFIPKLK